MDTDPRRGTFRPTPRHLGPMAPGLAFFFAGLWVENVHDQKDAVIMTISGIFMAAVLAVVYWLNVRAANRLQHDLDLLAE